MTDETSATSPNEATVPGDEVERAGPPQPDTNSSDAEGAPDSAGQPLAQDVVAPSARPADIEASSEKTCDSETGPAAFDTTSQVEPPAAVDKYAGGNPAEDAPAVPNPAVPNPAVGDGGSPAVDASSSAAPPTDTTVSESDPPARRKIQVGSRRGDQAPTSSKPQVAIPSSEEKGVASDSAPAGTDTTDRKPDVDSTGRIVAPTRRTPLPPDVEKAVDEALSDVSIDDLISSEKAAEASQEIELGSRRHGQVVRVHGDHVFFSIGGRNEGIASVRQFKEPPTIGDAMEVVVKTFQADDGLYEVAIPGAAVSVADWSDLTEGAVVEARISGANTGGLECMVNQIRGFIPSSQIGLFRVEDFAEYIGQKLNCVVTEVNPKRRNLVLSHRALLEREKEEARAKLLETLEPGQTVEGVVRNLRDFGAFVDIGGLDGLIHISQLSWERVNHPSDVLTDGQKVRVRIEKVNKETGKIGLSYRDLLEHPWENVERDLEVGSTVQGPVTRIAKFGAFVRLGPGIEGLIHISELAHHRVRQVSEVVAEGQTVDVKILSIDKESQRIALSLKATLPEPEKSERAGGDDSDAEKTPVIAAKRKGPLKGGFDRPTGGEEFGLKW